MGRSQTGSPANRFAQAAIDTSNHEKALKDAVEYCKATYPQIIGGHSTQWYDQGGPGDPWDYDGDDDLSLERTFEIFDIDSKEKVDALAKAGKMSKTVEKGNFSTTYKVVFKNDDSNKAPPGGPARVVIPAAAAGIMAVDIADHPIHRPPQRKLKVTSFLQTIPPPSRNRRRFGICIKLSASPIKRRSHHNR